MGYSTQADVMIFITPLIKDDTVSLVMCISCGFLRSDCFFNFKQAPLFLAWHSCVLSLQKTIFLLCSGCTSFFVPLFHPCGTLVRAGEMFAFLYAKLTLYIKAVTCLQHSAMATVQVHRDVLQLLAVNRAFCKQNCVCKATHPI